MVSYPDRMPPYSMSLTSSTDSSPGGIAGSSMAVQPMLGTSVKATISRTTPKRRISEEEWLINKERIAKLYLTDGKDVREVRNYMSQEFGFRAHEKAYKRKFEDWGLTKNIPKHEGLYMVRKRLERQALGKETVFYRRRRRNCPDSIVSGDKLDRIADRYSHDLNSMKLPPMPKTPEFIRFHTPPPSGNSTQTFPFPDLASHTSAPSMPVMSPVPMTLAPMHSMSSMDVNSIAVHNYSPNHHYQHHHQQQQYPVTSMTHSPPALNSSSAAPTHSSYYPTQHTGFYQAYLPSYQTSQPPQQQQVPQHNNYQHASYHLNVHQPMQNNHQHASYHLNIHQPKQNTAHLPFPVQHTYPTYQSSHPDRYQISHGHPYPPVPSSPYQYQRPSAGPNNPQN